MDRENKGFIGLAIGFVLLNIVIWAALLVGGIALIVWVLRALSVIA